MDTATDFGDFEGMAAATGEIIYKIWKLDTGGSLCSIL